MGRGRKQVPEAPVGARRHWAADRALRAPMPFTGARRSRLAAYGGLTFRWAPGFVRSAELFCVSRGWDRMGGVDEVLRDELVGMAGLDEAVRDRLAADGSLFEGYHPEMEQVHVRNAARLTEILDAGGWPGRDRVGKAGADAAWLIVQHAISDPVLQRRGLELLRAAGDVDPVQVAMLDDRIRGFEGRPQLYGTQFDWDENGELSPKPMDDPELVDRRRAELGLPPMAEAVARMRASVDGQAPSDLARHRAEEDAWARRVGWRQSPS